MGVVPKGALGWYMTRSMVCVVSNMTTCPLVFHGEKHMVCGKHYSMLYVNMSLLYPSPHVLRTSQSMLKTLKYFGL